LATTKVTFETDSVLPGDLVGDGVVTQEGQGEALCAEFREKLPAESRSISMDATDDDTDAADAAEQARLSLSGKREGLSPESHLELREELCSITSDLSDGDLDKAEEQPGEREGLRAEPLENLLEDH